MNVNVVLFPEGEDPDSYVKKIGGIAFKKFLLTSKSDFISFKTKLFLEDAKNDPIKKSEVIREIISSISKIPDPIQRQVFLKQCSKLLEIDEQVLISESNKVQILKSKIKQEKEDKEFVIPEFFQEEEVQLNSLNILQLHEREIIRLLLNYGESEIEGNINVKKYLLQEVEDRDFKHPLYKKMLEIFKENNLEKGDPLSFFISHHDKEVSREAIDLISSKYELSKNWEKFKIFVTTEKTNLGTALYTTVIRLKWRDICEMIEENKENLKNTEDETEVDTHLKIHMKLKEAEREVAGILGNVFR
jgi:DNA primase